MQPGCAGYLEAINSQSICLCSSQRLRKKNVQFESSNPKTDSKMSRIMSWLGPGSLPHLHTSAEDGAEETQQSDKTHDNDS